MKKLFIIAATTTSLLLSTSTASAAINTKAYQPSKKYSEYFYKEYDKKGNLRHLWHDKLVKTGPMKGAWQDLTQGDIYTDYSYDKKYGLTAAGGSKHNFEYGSFKFWDLLPPTVRKNQTGTLQGSQFVEHPYKILSTKATVKTKNGTYKNAIKVWEKNYGENILSYYVKNRGKVKSQTLYQGEYRTTYVLYKIKK